jgi:hypothetical protein
VLFPALKEEEDANRSDDETDIGGTRMTTVPPPTYGAPELLVAESARACSWAVMFGFRESETVPLPEFSCFTLLLKHGDVTGLLTGPLSVRGGRRLALSRQVLVAFV